MDPCKIDEIETPLGPMLAVADEKALHLLDFAPCKSLKDAKISAFTRGRTSIIDQIEEELRAYFRKQLKEFLTPIAMKGTAFQKKTWLALKNIPFGTTCSYAQIAEAVGSPLAARAVGTANGANQWVIMIPCHRVIRASGDLGGYGGGLARKKWLLHHEKR